MKKDISDILYLNQFRVVLFIMFIIISTSGVWAQEKDSKNIQNKLPYSDPVFKGKIGKTYKESTAAWPEIPKAAAEAPNVIIVLLDDVGFGQTSTFGGLIPTPNLDKLASQGIKYNRFHTTAICGPSRAALLTGRNHHDAGNGFLMEWATGFPNYSTMIPKSTATMGEVLKDNGYSIWWYGKNHNTPDWETSVAGPFDRWPTGLGFDYFYGFNAGEAHQYYPVIFENTLPVEPNKSPEEGYHLLTDMTDRAISKMKYSKSVAPNKPFFMYFAPGGMHAPHHVTKEWRDQFKGKFDMGWEKYREQVFENQKKMGIIPPDTKLTPKPDWVPAWETLNDKQKKVYNALFENYAGYFAFTDHEVGRLLDAIKELPDAENTLVIYIVGDNGASSEGGPDGTMDEIKSLSGMNASLDDIIKDLDKLGGPETEPHYPVGWAWAGNTPFQWVKQVASHLGGSRNPMVVSWPARIKHDDTPRDAFLHLIDIAPTVYEVAHVTMPEYVNGIKQIPLEGKSFVSTFTDNSYKGRTEQYFEILSNRSIYEDGWKANAQHTLPWRQDVAPGNWDNDKWELYNLNSDFSEANDLAAKLPSKLAEMKKKFDEAAVKYHVYPLDDRGVARALIPKPLPPGVDPKITHFVYYPGATRLPETASPAIKNRSWTITADVTGNGQNTNGVIIAAGGVSAGVTLYVKDGIPIFDYNYYGKHTIIKSQKAIDKEPGIITLDFVYAGGGMGKGAELILKVNGQEAGREKMEATVFARFGADTFGIGEDSGQPVTFDYKPPFKFNGTIEKVIVDLK
ncbi:arylsulfatase [Flavobacterium sp. LHD-80]|uniref:arylsulfatase n=1 Tax=Flavobacterium sp. LHD-80 TaxID=3071411 RepID=UPI0027E0067F|nr:arylsulfatase [Flavobacterium sp. LHD-80]MDQ6473111.1 arylsulfatase [Flavobacterium sp. LHD-80]